MMPWRTLGRVLLPGIVLQSVVVAGAYGTGLEVLQWVTSQGPSGGFLAVSSIALALGITLALTFDLARRHNTHDYRRFFRVLLGRAWWLYEVVFVAALVLLLAVGAAAAGEVVADSLSWPHWVGVLLMLLIIVVLNYLGRDWVDRSLVAWGILMSVLLLALVVAVLYQDRESIAVVISESEMSAARAAGSGLQFFLYMAIIVPPMLYAAIHLKSTAECWAAGLMGGILVALPSLAYHIAFLAYFPEVLEQVLPTYWLLQQFAVPGIIEIYTVVLFVTIAQTGVGVLQGVNERLDNWWRERSGRPLSRRLHGGIAGLAVLASLLIARFGIANLVARGYGSLAWVSLALFILPLVVMTLRRNTAPTPPGH